MIYKSVILTQFIGGNNMYVVYDNELWRLGLSIRQSLFEDWKQSRPEQLVWIFREGEQKQVKLKDLTDYSVYRNT